MNKKWRGIMTGILGISMLLGSLGSVSAAPVPKDIQGHWAQSQLQEWLDAGYLHGYQDGTVKPNKAITRGEYVALVNRLFGFTETTTISFKDLKSSNWAYTEVAKAVKAGYIGGYENNTFRSNNALTRQEAAVIVAKVLDLNTSSTSTNFKDSAQIASWSRGAVSAAAAKKIINGYPDGTFGPKKALTRAEAVGIISNSVIYKPTNPGGVVTPTPTPTATPTASPTPTATATPGSGSGGGGGTVTTPTVSGATYGNVGVVTADVYLTPSVTGTVYYVVAPYNSSAAVPSVLQVRDGLTSAGTLGVNHGNKATLANTSVSFSVYGLVAGTEYATYVTVADASGNWSTVSTVQFTTVSGTATSISQFEPGNVGTVTADVYVTYGQISGSPESLRYVVLLDSAVDPSAAQIAAGQNSSGVALTSPWTGMILALPGVERTVTLSGLATDTGYKIYLIKGTGSTWSPVEIIRIHTK
ncbi:S-layer homology domain-containing protein [Paenibacillus sp. 19GGS1-52]|uniref:S-layer homology domain-containing protein n=1 Tax=Paenibacillus sp. 19GGS1-52 TaxID=2758563 RepID=UPI001EFC108E|nr:S-layer homology domain-containing protein [Paenibacillus sp. 19GGS1-52]ULO07958.1 S-layer homology domain-containing protein [Paenibacillus sp. 19GGS1-52]